MRQLFMPTMAEEWGTGGGDAQSTHSVPNAHIGNLEPGLPSSQSSHSVAIVVGGERTSVHNEKKDHSGGEVAPRKG
jgi:hypothetical protein